MMAVYIENKRIEGHASSQIVGYAICRLGACTHRGDMIAKNAHSFDFQGFYDAFEVVTNQFEFQMLNCDQRYLHLNHAPFSR